MELTGTSEGTDKNPKMSLLKVNKETIISALEDEVVQIFNNNETRKVFIIKQDNSAGLHQDATYQMEI